MMEASRSSSYSSLVSAMTLDEDFGQNSSVAATNSVRSRDSLTPSIGNGFGNDHCSATVMYSEEASASLMTSTTIPSPRSSCQPSVGCRHLQEERYLRSSSSPFPFSLSSSLPSRQVSRFDLVCLNPPSSRAELKAPIHPSSQHSQSNDDDDDDDHHHDHSGEVNDHIENGGHLDIGDLDRHPSTWGTFNGNAPCPLNEPVHLHTQEDGDDTVRTRRQEMTLMTSVSLPVPTIRSGTSAVPFSVVPFHALARPGAAHNRSCRTRTVDLTANEGNVEMNTNSVTIIPNRHGPTYPRRRLSISSRRRYSLGPACSTTTGTGRKHTSMSRPIVEGCKKRTSHELLDDEVQYNGGSLLVPFQGSNYPPPKRFRRHSTPWLSNENRNCGGESELPKTPTSEDPSVPKQDDGTNYVGSLMFNKSNHNNKQEAKISVSVSLLTPSFAKPSHKTAIDTGLMMLQPKRQASAKFGIIADDEPPFGGGIPCLGIKSVVMKPGKNKSTEESPEILLHRARGRAPSMSECRDTLGMLPSLLHKSALPPSKPVRQKSFGHSNSCL